MAHKTVISHFYNEEWLLPFWLKHHREIFDHGVMIDYHSTDRSCDIIREICPTWQIVTSKNSNFEPHSVDREVVEHEASQPGWRIALNTTEFLVGNYHHMNDRSDQFQAFIGQFMVVDMERREEPYYLDSDKPIWEQRWHGYGIVSDFTKNQSHGSVPRAPRSLHNYAVGYPSVGRHFPNNAPTYNDLAIFYVGYASLEPKSIERKLQIQTQCPGGSGQHHRFNLKQLMDRFRKEQQSMSYDISDSIRPYVDAHTAYLTEKRNQFKLQTKEDINQAINTLQAALQRLQ